ncbi:MAG TPA: amidase [Acidimicrobiales bacterium]|jgi:amidase|nr:amidase [Acidimicrobiales bacterium]
MSTFITRYDTAGPGVRLAVKDLVDMEGEVTTAGCRAVAERARPAERDAACLAGARAAGARIVGRTNLHELALGVTGVNPWYGTPVNPLDPALVPGGSSSGSAVAVATGEADVAYGSDTGGSVRIPSACCGTAGLKTTWGRIPLQGVWPLAPSFDTVGPMARDVAGLVAGMELLEPGFAPADLGDGGALSVALLPVEGHPAITAAIDRAVRLAGWRRAEVIAPGWDDALVQSGLLLVVEAWHTDQGLVREAPEGIGDDVRARLELGSMFDDAAVRTAWETQRAWKATLERAFTQVDFLVTPTLSIFPPPLDDGDDLLVSRHTLPVNLAGVPALSLPVPTTGPLPASLQLIGPAGSEERLLAAGALLEAAVAAG